MCFETFPVIGESFKNYGEQFSKWVHQAWRMYFSKYNKNAIWAENFCFSKYFFFPSIISSQPHNNWGYSLSLSLSLSLFLMNEPESCWGLSVCRDREGSRTQFPIFWSMFFHLFTWTHTSLWFLTTICLSVPTRSCSVIKMWDERCSFCDVQKFWISMTQTDTMVWVNCTSKNKQTNKLIEKG